MTDIEEHCYKSKISNLEDTVEYYLKLHKITNDALMVCGDEVIKLRKENSLLKENDMKIGEIKVKLELDTTEFDKSLKLAKENCEIRRKQMLAYKLFNRAMELTESISSIEDLEFVRLLVLEYNSLIYQPLKK